MDVLRISQNIVMHGSEACARLSTFENMGGAGPKIRNDGVMMPGDVHKQRGLKTATHTFTMSPAYNYIHIYIYEIDKNI